MIKINKKGFAISGVVYPILIITLFLVVQILFMLQTRKNVLDKSRNELADTVNGENKVYTNEELSIIISEQQKKIDGLENKVQNTGKDMYPVGSIYTSIKNVNPSTIFGGTWVSYGAGKTLVGVDPVQSEFNSVEKTGGNKTSDHSHGSGGKQNGTLSAAIGSVDGDSSSLGFISANFYNFSLSSTYNIYSSRAQSKGGSFSHFTQVWGNTADATISNLQPYITVYMWKRTA